MAICVSVMTTMLHLYNFTISRGCNKLNTTHHAIPRISRKLYVIGSTRTHWRRYQPSATLRIYTSKIDGVVCPPNISETVAGRIMKLAHLPRIASTMIKLISKPILLPIFF